MTNFLYYNLLIHQKQNPFIVKQSKSRTMNRHYSIKILFVVSLLCFCSIEFKVRIDQTMMKIQKTQMLDSILSTNQPYYFKVDQSRNSNDFTVTDNLVTKTTKQGTASYIWSTNPLEYGYDWEVEIVSPNNYYVYDVQILAEKSHQKIKATFYGNDRIVISTPDFHFTTICAGDTITFSLKPASSPLIGVIQVSAKKQGKYCGGLIYNIWPDNDYIAYQNLIPIVTISNVGDGLKFKIQK